MAVLAVSAAWVGVVGAAVGAGIAFVGSWVVHRLERAHTIAERLRVEKKEAYASLLTSAEDSMHLFQWLAEGHVGPAGREEDKAKANYFYDQEVTPRLMVLRIIGASQVEEAASEMRRALNDLRHLMVDGETQPDHGSPQFMTAHARYRKTRDTFIERARADLEHGRRRFALRRPRAGSSAGP